MYIFFLLRYIEVYLMTWRVIPVGICIAVFTASIPISILSNETKRVGTTCRVEHSDISAWLPAGASIALAILIVVLFLEPILSNASGLFVADKKVRRAGYLVFLSMTFAAAFTVFFHVSLATPLEKFAPVLSSIDATINLASMTIPHFYVRLLQLRKMTDSEAELSI